MSTKETILVTGACGQLGSELSLALRSIYGQSAVVATDIALPAPGSELAEGPFEKLDVLDAQALAALVDRYQVTQIYHLAAILSASGEKKPALAWKINMDGLFNVLEVALAKQMQKVYWPSSIAVFGPDTPANLTPQHTIMNPTTVYGISKLAGEHWCNYYYQRYGLDVRSLRYPGLISYKTPPGGGTTDYAVDIFYKAIEGCDFECFLSEASYLPMMYMPDAIRATLELMHADAAKVKLHSGYNVSAMSFSPAEIYAEIRRYFPNFNMVYKPDFRQQIADSWPNSIDDSQARSDWGWQESYQLATMTRDMITQLSAIHKNSKLVNA